MSQEYQADFERIAALNKAVRELAERLGFYIAEVNVTDDRESEWPPKVEIVLRQKDPRI